MAAKYSKMIIKQGKDGLYRAFMVASNKRVPSAQSVPYATIDELLTDLHNLDDYMQSVPCENYTECGISYTIPVNFEHDTANNGFYFYRVYNQTGDIMFFSIVYNLSDNVIQKYKNKPNLLEQQKYNAVIKGMNGFYNQWQKRKIYMDSSPVSAGLCTDKNKLTEL